MLHNFKCIIFRIAELDQVTDKDDDEGIELESEESERMEEGRE